MINITEKAITRAIKLHEGQVRKDGDTPYIVHPLTVAFVLSHFTVDREIIAAAILHDTIEDCDYSLEELSGEFGPNVARLVDLLSEDKSVEDWIERKALAVEKVSQDRVALVIRAADCLVNMNDIYADLQKDGGKVWGRFNAPKAQKLTYFQSILERSRDHLPNDLLHDYVALLKDLEYSDAT